MLIYDLIKRFFLINPKCGFFVSGGGRSGVDTGDIPASLRFRSAASAHLSKVIGAGGTPNKLACHLAFKRGSLGVAQFLIQAYSDANNNCGLFFNNLDQLCFYNWVSGAYSVNKISTAQFRDPAASLYIDLLVDTTLATAEDRFQLWVNGSRLTSWNTNVNTHVQSNGILLGGNYTTRIGSGNGSAYADGYMSRVCFVWAPATVPPVTAFGYFNTEINEWVSKSQSAVKAVVDAGGANSFMLDFDNATSLTTLGYDKSSKGNNWTLNNFSLTAGTTYDRMLDVPGNSYCTLSPLDTFQAPTLKDGNLDITQSAAQYGKARGSLWFDAGGSDGYYFELHADSATVSDSIGIADATAFSTNNTGNAGVRGITARGAGGGNTWWGLTNDATYSPDTGVARAQGQVVSIAVRNGKLYAAINGTWVLSGNPVTEANPLFSGLSGQVTPYVSVYQSAVTRVNFGQRPFTYTPPVGFKALCQRNLPDVPLAIRNPRKQFDVKLWSGTDGVGATVSGIAFQPDLVYAKTRTALRHPLLIDSVRGGQKALYSSLANAETDLAAAGITSFNADGYTHGGSSGLSDGAGVSWLWKAGGAAVANNAGSIASQVSANVEAGFSIVTYTGTGANATVGHGLGRVPGLVIVKRRNVASGAGWMVGHKNLTSGAYNLYLNTTHAQVSDPTVWNSTFPTSSVFSIGTHVDVNNNTNTYVAYCFAEIAGFSKIGSYVGNGSADGPFVYCGFRPKFVMVKNTATGTTNNWEIHDTTRDGHNVSNSRLFANLSNAEVVTGGQLDLLSTGFKVRDTNTDYNNNGNTYIFYAVADVPAKYSLAR